MWVTNGLALAPPCSTCSTGVSASRKPRACSCSRSARVDDGPHFGHLPRGRADDQLDVPLPDPGLRIAEAGALVRERSQRLGGDGEGVGEHRQLPAPRGDDLTLDADVVTEVNVLLPGGQRVGAHPVQRDHDLQVAGAVPDRREAKLPAVAVEHHPPGHPDPVAGRGVRRQVRMAGPYLRDRRGAGKADGIGVNARGPHPLQLREAHLHLLGHIAAGSLRPVVRRSVARRSAALLIVGHLPEITGAPARAPAPGGRCPQTAVLRS